MMANEEALCIIKKFKLNQNGENLQALRNAGISLMVLKNSNWQPLEEYTLPLPRFIPLYNNLLIVHAIGCF